MPQLRASDRRWIVGPMFRATAIGGQRLPGDLEALACPRWGLIAAAKPIESWIWPAMVATFGVIPCTQRGGAALGKPQ
jgi:hypothetical protein